MCSQPSKGYAQPSAVSSGNSSFGQTLQFITDIKLHEVEKQRLAYDEYAKVLDTARTLGEKGEILEKVEVLVKAVKAWPGSGSLGSNNIVGGKLHLHDLEFRLLQARHDPSFTKAIAEDWAETLEAHIRHTIMRFGSAKLFGNLFNEWLASGDSVAVSYQRHAEQRDNDAVEEFVDVGRKEIHEQREKFTSIVFDDCPVDENALEAYLEDLFSDEEARKALDNLRKDMQQFGQTFQRRKISTSQVITTINGVIASGLVDEEKKAALKSFLENHIVLDEMTSVLNMRMEGLESWTWPKEGLSVEFRRHMNGKYRAFTDPDIVDALFLHFIGVSWQVRMKYAFTNILISKAWKKPYPLSSELHEKAYSQVRGGASHAINGVRERGQQDIFFMAQLQDRPEQHRPYDGATKSQSNKANVDLSDIKQKLLHIMTTEGYLNVAVHGTFAALCSDFEWFGPSLPHRSILMVLAFLGMPKVWLDLFHAFLTMPLRLPSEPNAEPRTRKRGTPINYSASVVCGEAIIFIMDFAVNQRADGLFLYRMHDDLWLWDADVKKVAKGWGEMKRYAELVGLKFNEQKTGSTYIGPDLEQGTGLPTGDIRWGLLAFDAQQSRFVIDQKDVDKHIKEMRRQLANTKSVFGWINVYNKYMAFFLRNMGGLPANCFGHAHVLDMISTLGSIQRELFSEYDGSAVGYLRKVIEERYGITDLPEGYFYFPIGRGGLELRNTMLEILTLCVRRTPLASLDENPRKRSRAEFEEIESSTPEDYALPAEERFNKRIKHDEKEYTRLKDIWDSTPPLPGQWAGPVPPTHVKQPFMSLEEYVSLRESWLSHWGQTYKYMLDRPALHEMALVPSVQAALTLSHPTASESRLWSSMDRYDKWVLSMYGEEVVKKFGGLEAVDPNLIPVGMVQLFRGSRVKLDQ